jgi:hypothetical protein
MFFPIGATSWDRGPGEDLASGIGRQGNLDAHVKTQVSLKTTRFKIYCQGSIVFFWWVKTTIFRWKP